jgi:hypothetical protein
MGSPHGEEDEAVAIGHWQAELMARDLKGAE